MLKDYLPLFTLLFLFIYTVHGCGKDGVSVREWHVQSSKDSWRELVLDFQVGTRLWRRSEKRVYLLIHKLAHILFLSNSEIWLFNCFIGAQWVIGLCCYYLLWFKDSQEPQWDTGLDKIAHSQGWSQYEDPVMGQLMFPGLNGWGQWGCLSAHQ